MVSVCALVDPGTGLGDTLLTVGEAEDTVKVKAVELAAAGVDHRHRPGAAIVGVVERRVGELPGADEGGGVAGIGVALGIVVRHRRPADEVELR